MSLQQYTLGMLIDVLAARAPDQHVWFDFGQLVPTDVDSYRGYYDHLAIGFAEDMAPTVGAFLPKLRDAVGAKFHGYKGGEYRMTRDTPLWAAKPGHGGPGLTFPAGWQTTAEGEWCGCGAASSTP